MDYKEVALVGRTGTFPALRVQRGLYSLLLANHSY